MNEIVRGGIIKTLARYTLFWLDFTKRIRKKNSREFIFHFYYLLFIIIILFIILYSMYMYIYISIF